jgi:hypothetical protein
MQARDAVRDDTATLDETGSVVDLNQAKVDENNARLKTQVTSTRSTLTLSLTTLTTPPPPPPPPQTPPPPPTPTPHPHHPPSPLTTHPHHSPLTTHHTTFILTLT